MVFTEIVTADDLVAGQRALAHAADFDPTFGVVVDLRGVDEIRMTPREMSAVAMFTPLELTTRLAILVRGEGAYGVARLYETVREAVSAGDVVRVCRSVEEAVEWLGVRHLDI